MRFALRLGFTSFMLLETALSAGVAEGRLCHATPASQETHTLSVAQTLGTLSTAAINTCNHRAQCEDNAMGKR
jgi:hypothetical protein